MAEIKFPLTDGFKVKCGENNAFDHNSNEFHAFQYHLGFEGTVKQMKDKGFNDKQLEFLFQNKATQLSFRGRWQNFNGTVDKRRLSGVFADTQWSHFQDNGQAKNGDRMEPQKQFKKWT
jgi:hypothetical protein